MMSALDSWQAKAAAKRASMLAKIPQAWVLEAQDLDRASKQSDLTGPFMGQFLEDHEKSIVSLDSLAIVDSVKSGKLSALSVTIAFSKAAAVAHQIVRLTRDEQMTGLIEYLF
jgi:amidase